VPTKNRLGRDEEGSPAFPRYEAGEQGDQGSIGPGEAGPGDLAAQHGELMAQHQYLGILSCGIRPMHADQFEDAAGQPVEEGQ
jgi:hypothetical protein